MKKWILAALLLVLSWNASAGSLYFGPTLAIQNTTSQFDNYRGFQPRLSGGYEDVLDCFYLAGEVFWVPGMVTIYESNTLRSESARTTYSYGLSFLPGLLLTEYVIAYLRLGYSATRFWGPNATKSGGQFGVGLQSDLTDNWSLRGEYIYTAYSNISYLGSPRSDQYGIGLIYKLK
jgi:opacity protein-like surface antigen